MPIKELIEQKIQVIMPEGVHPNDLDIDKLSDDQVFALLAWEMWKDGMDGDDDLSEIFHGRNFYYNTKEKAWHFLKKCFAY